MDQGFQDFGKLTRDYHANEFLRARRGGKVSEDRAYVPSGVYDLICTMINGINAKLEEENVKIKQTNYPPTFYGVSKTYYSAARVNWDSLMGKVVGDDSMEVVYNGEVDLGVVSMGNLEQVVDQIVAAIIFERF